MRLSVLIRGIVILNIINLVLCCKNPVSKENKDNSVAVPVLNPPPSTYVKSVDVKISCKTPYVVIHYTLNGLIPTEFDPVIENGGTIKLTSSAVLKVKAFRIGWTPSEVVGGNYNIIEIVFIHEATFPMGSDDYSYDEKPVHGVFLYSFYASKYEVTIGEFRDFINETGYTTTAESGEGAYIWSGSQWEKKADANWDNPYYNKSDKFPVSCVSWYDAINFCNWLSNKEGITPCYSIYGDYIECNFNAKGYRLLTEAEWEFAARGGKKSHGYLYSGSSNIDEVGWYKNNSEGRPHEIGGKKANELGIYDMTGNVCEWCWDWYSATYYREGFNNNPHGPSTGVTRVQRGGSWDSTPFINRITNRYSLKPKESNNATGFRIGRKF